MPNPFDQFDQLASSGTPTVEAPNPFDQFDKSAGNPFDWFDGGQEWKVGAGNFSNNPGAFDAPKGTPVSFVTSPTMIGILNTNIGRSIARGATSEGIYGVIEGVTRGIRNIPETLGSGVRLLERLKGEYDGDSDKDIAARDALLQEQQAKRLLDLQKESPLAGGIRSTLGDYADATGQLRADIRQALPVDPGYERSLFGQITQGTGQALGTLPLMVNPTLGSAGSVGQVYDEAFSEAKKYGATDSQANEAAVKYTALAGPLDIIGDKLVVGKLMKGLGGGPKLARIIKDTLVTGGVNAVTEGAQTGILNSIAADPSTGYDKGREISEGVVDSMIVGGIVPGGITLAGQSMKAMASIDARNANKTPEQKLDTLRTEEKLARDTAETEEQKAMADALTDAADAVEREVNGAKAIEAQQKLAAKSQADQQRALEQQDKAVADAQAQAKEVPKSTQILQESAKPKPLANIATEAGTQTSPFALQGRINELTAAPAPTPPTLQGITQQPAPTLDPLAMEGRQRAAAMRRQRDGVEAEIVEAPMEVTPEQTKANDIKTAVKNPETEYLYTVQQGGEGYTGYIQVDAILPSKTGAERNSVSSNVKDLNKAGAKLPEVPDWVPTRQYTLDELKSVIKQGKPKPAPETIRSAAVKLSDGKVVTGKTHGEIVADIPDASLYGADDGFVTSTGRYVSRDEAMKLAKKSGIVENKPSLGPEKLYTEHLDPAMAKPKPSIIKQPSSVSGVEALLTPARTAEAKLNNAGLEMPNVSGMTREAKRAELDAAGIKRYNGKAIADINPAELSNAVGKSRRGQLTPEGETKGVVSGSAVEKWANDVIKRRGPGSGATNTIDAEIIAAYAIKLTARLEVGAVKFGEWSKQAIAELGDAVRPHLRNIWEQAHKQAGKESDLPPEPRVISGSEDNRGVSKSELGKYDYLKDSNKEQEASGKRYVDYVKKTGDWDGALDAVDLIPNLADKAVAVAQLLSEADATLHTPDTMPEFNRIFNRLAPQVIGGKTEAGQALQAQGVVNKILEPLRPFLAWRGIIQSRIQEVVGSNFSPEASDKINAGMKDAGNKAAGVISRNIPQLSPESEANRLVNQWAKLQSDTLSWSDKVKQPVQSVLADYISGKINREAFLNATDGLNVRRAISETLASIADREISRRATTKAIDEQNRLSDKLDKYDAMLAPLRKVASQTGLDWRQIFTDLPENQAARKEELFKRIEDDPALANISAETRAKLLKASERAWETIRLNIFRSELNKVINLPDIAKEQKEALEKSLPKLTERANLGLLDNSAFLNALAQQYGIESIDGETGAKLRDLGQKSARTPVGVERNAVNQQIMDTLMDAKGVTLGALMEDTWFKNVMSAPNTAVQMGLGSIVNGLARTYTTFVSTAVFERKPAEAFKILGMFFSDLALSTAFGVDMMATGDKTLMPRYNQKFLESMQALENGRSPGGEWTAIYRRGGWKKQVATGFELQGRLLEAMDYIGAIGIRQQQLLYSAILRGDKPSYVAAMRRFDKKAQAEAQAQAVKELGPDARKLKLIARKREILNDGISDAITQHTLLTQQVVALNNDPFGITGDIFRGIKGMKVFNIARYPLGLTFLRSVMNLFQEASNWTPGSGQLNLLRTMWKNPQPTLEGFSLNKLSPEQARHINIAQATGLGLTAALLGFFNRDQPEDKEGKRRKWDISGGWYGIAPERQKLLRQAGESPYSITTPSGRTLSYKLMPFIGPMAISGHLRDQERFNKEKWDEKTEIAKISNAWLGGFVSVKDLSMASQFSMLTGILAENSRGVDESSFEKKIADAFTNVAVGAIPASSFLRELDYMMDEQRYKVPKEAAVIEKFLARVPFARRSVNDGKPNRNFFWDPILIEVSPISRTVGPAPSTDPAFRAVADKISMGMSLPNMSGNRQIAVIVDGKAVKRDMTPDEMDLYEGSVRKAFKRQINDVDFAAFSQATPQEAGLYATKLFGELEKYAANRIGTGKFDGKIPIMGDVSSALDPEYARVDALSKDASSATAIERAKTQVGYDTIMEAPAADRMDELRKIVQNDPTMAKKVLSYAIAPSTNRDALENKISGLGGASTAQHFMNELNKLKTPQEKREYLQRQIKAKLITKDVIEKMNSLGSNKK